MQIFPTKSKKRTAQLRKASAATGCLHTGMVEPKQMALAPLLQEGNRHRAHADRGQDEQVPEERGEPGRCRSEIRRGFASLVRNVHGPAGCREAVADQGHRRHERYETVRPSLTLATASA